MWQYGGRRIQDLDRVLRPLVVRPTSRLEYNIKMDVKCVTLGSEDEVDMAQNEDKWPDVAKAVVNFGVPWNPGYFLFSWRSVGSFSRIVLRGSSYETRPKFLCQSQMRLYRKCLLSARGSRLEQCHYFRGNYPANRWEHPAVVTNYNVTATNS
jgi:hypothetical protein